MSTPLPKRVYVAGPFRAYNPQGALDCFAVHQNITRAMAIGLAVARTGVAFPFIPHGNTFCFEGSAPAEIWERGDLAWLSVSDAILMLPDWQKSQGATVEHEFARARRIPVFYSLDSLLEWLSPPQESDR